MPRSTRMIRAQKVGFVALAGSALLLAGMGCRDDGASTTEAETVQQVSATMGNILNSVSASGSVAFPKKQTLTFGTSGTVESVVATVGARVSKGATLATLDRATLANLEKTVAQAQVALDNAKTALDTAKQPYSASALATKRQAVLSAQQEVENAQTALNDILRGSVLDQRQLQLQDAQFALDLAKQTLVNAQSARVTKSATVVQKLLDAEATYRQEFMRYLGRALTDAEMRKSPDDVLAAAGLDLKTLYDPEQSSAALLAAMQAKVSGADLGYDPYIIFAWYGLAPPGTGSGGTRGMAPVASQVSDALDASWAALELARQDHVKALPDLERAVVTAQLSMSKAEDALQTTRNSLTEAQKGEESTETRLRRARLDTAKAKLHDVQDDLATAGKGGDTNTVALRQQELVVAQSNLDSAKSKLVQGALVAPFDGIVSEVAVVAGDSVGAAAKVVVLLDPSQVQVSAFLDEVDVLQVREGQLATITVDAMRGTTLTGRVATVSPVPRTQQGVVSYPITVDIDLTSGPGAARNTAPAGGALGARQGLTGAPGGAAGILATITPQADGTIVLPNGQTINPAQLAGRLGQAGRGNQAAPTEAGTAAPAGQTASELLGSVLKEGLTATVNVVQSSVTGVVVVPARAVKGSGASAQVEVAVADGKTEMRTVEVGLTDGAQTEIRSGLNEGDKVVVRTAARTSAANATTQQQAAFIPIGGGGGGGVRQAIIGGGR